MVVRMTLLQVGTLITSVDYWDAGIGEQAVGAL
jgi:hypothetical protein